MTHFVQRRWLCLFLVAMAGIAVGGWLQAAEQSSTELPAPTIRVTTHLVLIDAVVTDKQGNPIAGLRPEDFVVEENGKAQKIATFAGPVQSTAGPASLPPGIYSNRSQYRSTGPVTVMLLDAINTPFSDQAYARRQMLSFVQDQYKPDQRMAVFTLTGSLNVLQDFTTDPQICMRRCSASGHGRRSSPARGEPRRARLQGMPRAGQLWPASMPAPPLRRIHRAWGPGQRNWWRRRKRQLRALKPPKLHTRRSRGRC
jgi:hypothetical protein